MKRNGYLKLDGIKSFVLFTGEIRKKTVILFGCGKLGESMLKYLQCCNIRDVVAVDNDATKHGTEWYGYIIQSLDDIKERYSNAVFVVANISFYEQMTNQLMGVGVKPNNIIICSEFRVVKELREWNDGYVREDRFFRFADPMSISFSQFRKEMKDKIRNIYFKLNMIISKPHNEQPQKKYNVSICAIFKNEAHYLAEWIVYHTIVGVEHFYLYNNFSSDNYLEVLDPYIRSGLVTLIDWPVNQGQIPAYQHCFDNYSKESQWIGLIDLDEFVTPVATDNIYSVLSKFENRGSVVFYWKMFTSAGLVHRDIDNLVTEDFTVCIGKYYNIGKCFVNTTYIPVMNKSIVNHEAWTIAGKRALPPVNTSDRISYFNKRQCASKKAFLIQINHYNLKSYDEYVERAKKGDAYFKKSPKSIAYFAWIDSLGNAEDKSAYKYLTELKRQLQHK